MIVSNWMSKNVITVGVDDSMHDAMKRMKEKDIRMLPVLKKGKLVGVVTDRDIKRASASGGVRQRHSGSHRPPANRADLP